MEKVLSSKQLRPSHHQTDAELLALQKQLRDLEEENEMLKKALHFLEKPSSSL